LGRTGGAIGEFYAFAQLLQLIVGQTEEVFTKYVFGTWDSGLVTKSPNCVSFVISNSPLVS